MTKGISKVTLETFIERSKVIHNNKYDYSKSVYTGYKENLTIICPIHGEFQLLPVSHLSAKRGCPKCCQHKLTTVEFIEKSQLVHSDRYDYSLAEYVNACTKVKIICKIHGEFLQTPDRHVNGKDGCKLCTYRYIPTTEGFIEASQKLHNSKYVYDKLVYISSTLPLIIICPDHGEFLQMPDAHISGKGCKKCATITVSKKLRQTNEQFIIAAGKIYGEGTYNYTNVKFNNHHDKISIICHKHGEFITTPDAHLHGIKLCPRCPRGKYKMENIWLDSLNIPMILWQKQIKIDNIKIRADAYDVDTNTIYEFWGDYWHGNPDKYGPNDINVRNNKTFGKLYEETQQKRKLILDAGYNLVEIWESEFNYKLDILEAIKILKEIKMANMSENNIRRLKQLILDGSQVLRECDDLREGLKETVAAIAEELEVKPALLNKFIKEQHSNKTSESRDDSETMEELRKAIGC